MNLAILTPRQTQVAELYAKRRTQREIAARLGISQETVKAHLRQAAERIGGTDTPRFRMIRFFNLTE